MLYKCCAILYCLWLKGGPHVTWFKPPVVTTSHMQPPPLSNHLCLTSTGHLQKVPLYILYFTKTNETTKEFAILRGRDTILYMLL